MFTTSSTHSLNNKSTLSLAEGAHKVYLFGMAMVGRDDQGDYRFGFNGKEKNTEWDNGSYDFDARMYDARLGRWSAVDPLAKEYPDISGYTYVTNNPIYYIDPDGKKIIVADKAQQAIVLGYLKEQFGSDIYVFNKKGELRLDKKAFKTVSGEFSAEQSDIATGLTKVTKSSRVIEVIIYPNKDIDFSRNPLIRVWNCKDNAQILIKIHQAAFL
jgi:RHS repeat-associated protein